jgi:hypothetical protein
MDPSIPWLPWHAPVGPFLYHVELPRRADGAMGLNVGTDSLGRGVSLLSAAAPAPDESPARAAALQLLRAGDILVAVAERRVRSQAELRTVLPSCGNPVRMTLLRGGQGALRFFLRIVRPEEGPALRSRIEMGSLGGELAYRGAMPGHRPFVVPGVPALTS